MALRGVRLLTERSLARSAVALEGIRVRRPLRGNKQLRNLGAGYIEKNFQYSILEIFDMNKSPKEIIDREHWWMDILGSVRRNNDEVPHGYNSVAERENSDQHE